jgi:drug/metabolite transporter (DMT)-like permease
MDMDMELLKEIAIPVAAFGIGLTLLPRESTAVPGKLAMFFGAQTVMNLYMKETLSGIVVSEEENLKGIPSAFIVTAIQQMVAFFLFGFLLLGSQLTPWRYTPKPLTTRMEWLTVLLFSLSFTMNIALNNFSISLLPLSVNLIIRSCLPLATFVSQRAASKCTGEAVKDARPLELALMLAGVFCAALAVVAKSHDSDKGSSESRTLVFGIVMCLASLFSGAINLALAGVLGTAVSLNSLDTTLYMSIPAFVILSVPSLLYRHPVGGWPGMGEMTDWEILMKVLELRPTAVTLAAISGVLALMYNVFQYNIVQTLSASYTAFAGNFNKAATIALGLIVGLETLPPGVWGIVMVAACLGNIVAFTAFNIVKAGAKKDTPSFTRAEQEPLSDQADQGEEESGESSCGDDSSSSCYDEETPAEKSAASFGRDRSARGMGA